ncbi:hypothetical protein [Frankia sp. Cas4]|uniref:hypothetical protein n=1 Tax=Frankia sp. Cas4 TaxID=3073927 RepID=UPI002AD392C7|nr:hypothetical protein [Frankia sp. Cas4]
MIEFTMGTTPCDDPPPDQAWFWTSAWQAGERKADEDIVTGRTTAFRSLEEFDAYAREIVADGDEHLPAAPYHSA